MFKDPKRILDMIREIQRLAGLDGVHTGRICELAGLLENTDLSGADLSGLSFEYGDMWSVCLRDANLRGCDLTSVRLIRCDLRGADLRDSILWGANFSDCLTDSKTLFEGANIVDARMIPCEAQRLVETLTEPLRGKRMCGCSVTIPAGAKLVRARDGDYSRCSEYVIDYTYDHRKGADPVWSNGLPVLLKKKE